MPSWQCDASYLICTFSLPVFDWLKQLRYDALFTPHDMSWALYF